MLVHNVYFTLKEPTKANIDHLLAECKKYLTDHPSVTYFGCGTLADLDRPVNDRLFDVGLHVIFADRTAHDKYQVNERHVVYLRQQAHLAAAVYDTF